MTALTFKVMKYTVLDKNGEASGSLEMVIYSDYAALSKEMGFDRMPEGFHLFEKQLPVENIYPIAMLEWLEIDRKNRRRGIGLSALQAFRNVAEEHGARLGLLRVGTEGVSENEDIVKVLQDRQAFYERDAWTRLENPPYDGMVVFWMYNLLSLTQPKNQNLRICLVEKSATDFREALFTEPVETTDALSEAQALIQ